jgi:hypothetical protein
MPNTALFSVPKVCPDSRSPAHSPATKAKAAAGASKTKSKISFECGVSRWHYMIHSNPTMWLLPLEGRRYGK